MATRVYAAMAQESVVKAEAMRGTPLALGKGKGDELWLTNSVSASYTLVAGALGGFQAANEVLAGFRHALQSNWSLAQRLGFGFADIEASGLRYQYRAYLVDVALLHRLEFPSLQVLLGPSVGVAYSQQTLFSGERQAGALFRYGGLATLVFPLAGRLSAEVTWDLGGTALRLNGQLVQRLLVRAGIGVNYGF